MATMNGAAKSTFASPDSTGKLSRPDAAAYLDRISLPYALLDQPPSLDLLRQLQSSHILAVPFESLSLHVKDWQDDEAEILLGGGEVVGLGGAAFHRIVRLRRGGFCFSINSSFAALLRFWDFRVSECAARVYSHQRKDPEEAGWSWEPTSHQCVLSRPFLRLGLRAEPLGTSRDPSTDSQRRARRISIVDWEGSSARWFVDVGFGSAQCSYPCVLSSSA